jgi:ribulose-5-phosphate 4-epimerase/fuculose-1-phosphate aldolase
MPSIDIKRSQSFSSTAEERRHRQETLVIAFRLFGKFGFEEGTAGHITARDPEYPNHFWVNPYGVSFKHIRLSDLILVNHQGEVVDGHHPVNEAAFAIHSQVHGARPDVVAAAHSHSITQDVCAFYECHALYDGYNGIVTDLEEGKRIAAALGGHKAVILRNHGLLTVGGSVEAAAWWFITMERSCQVQLLAKAAGRVVHIDHEAASAARARIGNEEMAWFNFQPLRDQIIRTDADIFD